MRSINIGAISNDLERTLTLFKGFGHSLTLKYYKRLRLLFMQLTRDLFAIAKFLLRLWRRGSMHYAIKKYNDA